MSCKFDLITKILNEIEISEYDRVISSCKDIFNSPEIKIGLWGDFSSGKSSFLNAMLGDEIFPVNITEMTAMTTELKYGEKLEIIAVKGECEYSYSYTKELAHILLTRVFKFDDLKASARKKLDSHQFDLEISKIKKDCIYREDTCFDDFLDKVIIKCNFDILKSGIVFVDLPGLQGSSSHSAITAAEIKKCSMVIFFKSSDRPMSKYDKEVLDDLKDANEKMVLFGIYNKIDLEFKSHYKELGNNDFLISMREEILNLFKTDVEKFANLDEYFGISPLMMHYFNMKGGDHTAALKMLKEDHPSKFRFLKEDHNYDLIAGISDFNDRFFLTISRLRDTAKKRVIEGKFIRVIREIDQSIFNKENAIKSNVELSLEEYESAMANLALQKAKQIQLKSFGPKTKLAIKSEMTSFVSDNVQVIAENTLEALSHQTFSTHDGFNNELSRNMSKAISHYLMGEGKNNFAMVVEKGLHSIKNEIDMILEDISEVTGDLLIFDQQIDLINVIDTSNLSTISVHTGMSVDAQVTSGAVLLDVGLILADVGTFGIATIARLAFAGFKSSENGGSFSEGVVNAIGGFFSGLFALAESQETKERRSMEEFRSNLMKVSFRRSTATSIVSQTKSAYVDYLSDIVVEILTDNEDVKESIESIVLKIDEAQRIVQDALENKQKSEEAKRVELAKLQQGRESIQNNLNDFFEANQYINEVA